MVTLLKQSTAVTIPIGPYVDATDGFTEETGLTLAQADFRLSKNGGAFAQKNEATTAAHMEHGWYGMLLDATDTNTLGKLVIHTIDAGARAVYREYMVVPANIYDSWISGTDVLDVSVTQLAGVTQSLTDLKDFADTGYDPATHNVAEVDSVAALGTQAKADVLAEVHTEINTTARAEPGQGAPAANASLGAKVDYGYKWQRNKRDLNKTTGQESYYNDNAATVDHKRTASDDGTTASVTEIGTGP